jgi:hypothetical protein
MKGFRRLVLRVFLSLILAFILTRIFFQGASIPKALMLALALLIFAYLFEYTRKSDEGGDSS